MHTTHDYRLAGHANSPRSPFAWLGRLGFRRSDFAVMGVDLRLQGGAVLALHRDGSGAPLGVERISQGHGGRLRYMYTPGRARGLFRAVPAGARRLVFAEGPLPAAAVAALDESRTPTAYAGGSWCEVAAAAVRQLVLDSRFETVVLAVAATPVGARAAEHALEDLEGLDVRVEVVEAPRPGNTWLATLAAARGVAANYS